ncbi:MAG: hypothetical protein ACRC42_00495, partial [Mycoplasma sp.]
CKGNCINDFDFRTPGLSEGRGVCASICSTQTMLKQCPNSSAGWLTYPNSFQCQTSFPRINYHCFDEFNSINKGGLFYSRCNKPWNIYHDMSANFKTHVPNGYTIEMWFTIDNMICPTLGWTDNVKYIFFYAAPHMIYYLNNQFYYNIKNSVTNYETKITGIHAYEWNKIIIMTNLELGNVKVSVYVNFQDLVFEVTGAITQDMSLSNIAFCSGAGNPRCTATNENLTWGSAYYNNIRIWNYETSSFDVIQAFNNKMFSETPKSLVWYYPLTIQYLDNNRMTNILPGWSDDIVLEIPPTHKMYNDDNILQYNYSSKFDWGLNNPDQFVIQINRDTKIVTSGNCEPSCKRCYESNDDTKCYECNKNFVLIYQKCSRLAESSFFLKTPIATANT